MTKRYQLQPNEADHIHLTARIRFQSSCSQHSTTWWSDHCAFYRSTQYHMVVRSLCIPPVNTVPHDRIIVHSTCQHSTTWWADHCAFHWSTKYHMMIQSLCIPPSTQYHIMVQSCIPPVNTVPHGGHIKMHSTSQHSTTRWSDHRAFHQTTHYHTMVRMKACEKKAGPSTQQQNSLQHNASIFCLFQQLTGGGYHFFFGVSRTQPVGCPSASAHCCLHQPG